MAPTYNIEQPITPLKDPYWDQYETTRAGANTSTVGAATQGFMTGATQAAQLSDQMQSTRANYNPERLAAEQLQRELNAKKTEEAIRGDTMQNDVYEKTGLRKEEAGIANTQATTANTRINTSRTSFLLGQDQKFDSRERESVLANRQSEINKRDAGEASSNQNPFSYDENGQILQPTSSNGYIPEPSIAPPAPTPAQAAYQDREQQKTISSTSYEEEVTKGKQYEELNKVDTALSNERLANRQREENSALNSVVDNNFNHGMEALTGDDISGGGRPNIPAAQPHLSVLTEASALTKDADMRKAFSSKTAVMVEKAGGADAIIESINGSSLPQNVKDAQINNLYKTMAYGDPAKLPAQQKSIMQAFTPLGPEVAAKAIADPNKVYTDLESMIAGRSNEVEDGDLKKLSRVNPYIIASNEASKNGTQSFMIRGANIPGASKGDTSQGGGSSKGMIFYGADDSTIANAPAPQTDEDHAMLDILDVVSKRSVTAHQANQNAQGVTGQMAERNSPAPEQPIPTPAPSGPAPTGATQDPAVQAGADVATQETMGQADVIGSEGQQPQAPTMEAGAPNIPQEAPPIDAPISEPNQDIVKAPSVGGNIAVTNKKFGTTVHEIPLEEGLISQEYQKRAWDRGLRNTDSTAKAYEKAVDSFDKKANPIRAQMEKDRAKLAIDKDIITKTEQLLTKINATGNQKLLGVGGTYDRAKNYAESLLKLGGAKGQEGREILDQLERIKSEALGDKLSSSKMSTAANTATEQKTVTKAWANKDNELNNLENYVIVGKAENDKQSESAMLRELLLGENVLFGVSKTNAIVRRYEDSKYSSPIKFNTAKYDADGNMTDPEALDYIKNDEFLTAEEYVGLKEKEQPKKKVDETQTTKDSVDTSTDTRASSSTTSQTPTATPTPEEQKAVTDFVEKQADKPKEVDVEDLVRNNPKFRAEVEAQAEDLNMGNGGANFLNTMANSVLNGYMGDVVDFIDSAFKTPEQRAATKEALVLARKKYQEGQPIESAIADISGKVVQFMAARGVAGQAAKATGLTNVASKAGTALDSIGQGSKALGATVGATKFLGSVAQNAALDSVLLSTDKEKNQEVTYQELKDNAAFSGLIQVGVGGVIAAAIPGAKWLLKGFTGTNLKDAIEYAASKMKEVGYTKGQLAKDIKSAATKSTDDIVISTVGELGERGQAVVKANLRGVGAQKVVGEQSDDFVKGITKSETAAIKASPLESLPKTDDILKSYESTINTQIADKTGTALAKQTTIRDNSVGKALGRISDGISKTSDDLITTVNKAAKIKASKPSSVGGTDSGKSYLVRMNKGLKDESSRLTKSISEGYNKLDKALYQKGSFGKSPTGKVNTASDMQNELLDVFKKSPNKQADLQAIITGTNEGQIGNTYSGLPSRTANLDDIPNTFKGMREIRDSIRKQWSGSPTQTKKLLEIVDTHIDRAGKMLKYKDGWWKGDKGFHKQYGIIQDASRQLESQANLYDDIATHIDTNQTSSIVNKYFASGEKKQAFMKNYTNAGLSEKAGEKAYNTALKQAQAFDDATTQITEFSKGVDISPEALKSLSKNLQTSRELMGSNGHFGEKLLQDAAGGNLRRLRAVQTLASKSPELKQTIKEGVLNRLETNITNLDVGKLSKGKTTVQDVLGLSTKQLEALPQLVGRKPAEAMKLLASRKLSLGKMEELTKQLPDELLQEMSKSETNNFFNALVGRFIYTPIRVVSELVMKTGFATNKRQLQAEFARQILNKDAKVTDKFFKAVAEEMGIERKFSYEKQREYAIYLHRAMSSVFEAPDNETTLDVVKQNDRQKRLQELLN
jgi:hypothetical protein